jgi:phosphopantothenoylcysteine decarboxylase/phosphopantothenate--cysteine ligase
VRADGVTVMEPDEGPMACGEYGPGRLPEPQAILAAIQAALAPEAGPLAGKHVLVTAGPTHEPIDPVRYIANRSSGNRATRSRGRWPSWARDVTLIAGPVTLADPRGVDRVDVETAREMLAAVDTALARRRRGDGRSGRRLAHRRCGRAEDQEGRGRRPHAQLDENPDILATLGHQRRPAEAGRRVRRRDRTGDRTTLPRPSGLARAQT